MNRTSYFTKADAERKWYVVDAKDQVLGRLATKVAKLLIGKHTPHFTYGQDTGAFVVVVNARDVKVTGKKLTDKIYFTHSMYPGGLKAKPLGKKLSENAAEAFRFSVRGMLPRNKIGDRLITKLKVYNGPTHPHQAQKPSALAGEDLAAI
jgi:large subunit ribosomal protein L13